MAGASLIRRLAAGLLAAGCVFGAPAAAPASDPVEACTKAQEAPDQVEVLCTAALGQSGLPDRQRAALQVQRGLARMRAGRLDAAGEDFEGALHLDPDSSWAHNARAVFHMQKGQLAQAISDYQRAVELAPGYAFAWANLGNARLAGGEVSQALSDLDRAVALGTQHPEGLLTSRGRVRLAQGACQAALADFDAALAANARHANAYSGRGYAHICQGDFSAAVADFRAERALRQDAESALDLVISLLRSGSPAADEVAGLTRASDPARGQEPGLALFAGTITPEQALQAAADRDPRTARLRLCQASFELAEWYLVHGDPARARQHFTQARTACDPSQRQYGAAAAELARLAP